MDEPSPPIPEIRRHEKTVKKALKKDLFVDLFSCAKYRMSPYMACAHGCLYCDGRAEKYFVQGEFDRDIVIRQNLPDLLKEEIPKLRETGTVSIGSGITDVYQPVEAEEKLMRRCGEILLQTDLPVSVLTKSALIQRDMDIWSRVNEKNGFILAMSLTTENDDLRRIFEPHAASVPERLATIKAFKEKGCAVGVLAMPFLPMINDATKEIRSLFATLADLKVDFIIPGSLTLRPGAQKATFFTALERHFPDKVADYKKLYGANQSSGMANPGYLRDFHQRIRPLLRNAAIPHFIPHRLIRSRLPVYDEIYLLLHQMQETYDAVSIDTTRLRMATEKYTAWLSERKKKFNRKRSATTAFLTEPLRYMLLSGEFAALLDNPKLAEFIKEVVIAKKVFDPLSRQLMDPHP